MLLNRSPSWRHGNVPAPQIAIEYWTLPPDARLRDVVLVIRDDEAGHRNANHEFADKLTGPHRPPGARHDG